MSNLVLLYWLVCIPVRTSLAVGIKYIPIDYLPYTAIIAFIAASLWLWRFFTNKPNSKGSFGQSVWWNKMRVVHSLIWIAFGVLALLKNKYAYLLLLLDVLVGIGGWFLLKPKN